MRDSTQESENHKNSASVIAEYQVLVQDTKDNLKRSTYNLRNTCEIQREIQQERSLYSKVIVSVIV
jgi:hypothetical protein